MRFGIIGSQGKMGKMIYSVFQEKGSECVFKQDLTDHSQTEKPEILIDFSLPGAVNDTISLVHQFGCPLLVGTTGYSEESFAKLQKISASYPVFYSANYSMGVQLVLRMLESIQPFLKEWSVGIHEIHHPAKKDKPSGTAKRLQEALQIPVEITSQRLVGFPGEHTVILSQDSERIAITHQALSRRIFAEGAYQCAVYLLKQSAGWFTFDDFFHQGKG